MADCPADLFADSGLAGADRFNILLIKHDVIGPRRSVKRALFGRGHAMEETQEQPPLLPPTAVMAGSAAYPLPEQQRYEYDCEILVGSESRAPRLP